ncbi:MAG TPA: sigma-70 family RNA polymerase sigma factor [Streptosporangiaceae bacterium]|nr:sigma-70 family RNA polymerase sigma factor [Streptosporangiaceae bacterium]
MRDREMMAAIVAGDPAGLGAAYDRYAAHLYSYCLSLLNESADAADAVQDTFIIAAAKLSALRDPDRLRPWLYAVARNECRRRVRAREAAAPLDEAAEVSDDTAELGTALEQAELRELVWSALAGLTPSEREIIELSLGHELAGADLADALGVPRNQAHAMASRARAHLSAPGGHPGLPSGAVSTAVASAPSSGSVMGPLPRPNALPGGAWPAAPATASSGPPAGRASPASPTATSSQPGSVLSAGPLTVSPAGLALGLSLGGSWTGTLTLTATGGPVAAYHITVAAPYLQDLTLSRSSGSLAAGQSVRITVTAAGGGLFSAAILNVDPGGLAVTVSYQLGL